MGGNRTVYFGELYSYGEGGVWEFGADGVIHQVTSKISPSSLAWIGERLLATADSFVFAVAPDSLQLVAGNNKAHLWPLGGVASLAVDADGNLYAADQPGGIVRELAADGSITIIA